MFTSLFAILTGISIGSLTYAESATEVCTMAETKLKTWTKDGAETSQQIWRGEQITETLAILPRLRAATAVSDTGALEDKLKTDFAGAYPRWDRAAREDCPGVRLQLLRPLINAAKSDSKLRIRVRNELTDELRAPRASTLLGAMIGFVILGHALDQGLWADAAKIKAKVAANRAKFKKQIHPFTEKYPDGFDKLDLAAKRDAILKEIDLARKIKRELLAYLARLS